MPSFSELLLAARRKERPPVLIASLPRNDPALAQAALEGGADVVKVHIHLQHRASQTVIVSLAEERPALAEILRLCGSRPTGIVPGASASLDADEVAGLVAMGFRFFSMYLANAPLGALPPSRQVERMLALSHTDPLETAETLDRLDLQVCEMSIMDPASYGQPLSYADLAAYAAIRRRTRLPLVAPSQHAIPPEALPELAALGIEGVMLGSIVCGSTPEGWFEAFRRFRAFCL
jgi:hypothetical protein